MKLLIASLLVSAFAFAAAPAKNYQVTGNVTDITDTTMTIDKAGEKFVLRKDGDTKVTGDMKVGSKVTAKYTMTATEVETKADAKKAKK